MNQIIENYFNFLPEIFQDKADPTNPIVRKVANNLPIIIGFFEH
jgi:hypothetical protein